MYLVRFSVVKLTLSNKMFLNIENERSTSTEVINAYYIQGVLFKFRHISYYDKFIKHIIILFYIFSQNLRNALNYYYYFVGLAFREKFCITLFRIKIHIIQSLCLSSLKIKALWNLS